jgi:hypothetical protein
MMPVKKKFKKLSILSFKRKFINRRKNRRDKKRKNLEKNIEKKLFTANTKNKTRKKEKNFFTMM